MPSTMASCFPKIKRPQSQDLQSSDDRDPPFPVFIRNFNSLYSSQITTTAPPPVSAELQYGSSAMPDLSAVYTSRRFFISSPGQSNSIIDSSVSSASSSSLESDASVFKNSVAVPTYSPDPYADFRRSMEEMVEARETGGGEDSKGKSDWEYLHELLLCYLALNPKATHKFIIGAFADLVVDHMSTAPAAVRRSGPCRRKADDAKSSRLQQ